MASRFAIRWRALLCSAILALAPPPAFPNSGQAKTQLGNLTFITPVAAESAFDPASFAPIRLSQSLRSFNYLGRVGGVAFEGSLRTESGIKVVNVLYDRTVDDGWRLVITWEKDGSLHNSRAALYDWQLIPIARFAATDQHACFTLFGELKDKQQQDERLARGEHVLGYNKAFENTLLGWRLLQADLLVIRPDACDLPTEDGRYFTGAGEEQWLTAGRPNVEANRRSLRQVQPILNGGSRFTSYVICDIGQEVNFSIDPATQLVNMTGWPYWYCWRNKAAGKEGLKQAQDTANRIANERLRKEFEADRNVMSADLFNRKWTDEFQHRRFSENFDRIASESLIEPMTELSNRLSAAIKSADGINPVLYSSLINTMRYSALLRQIRRESPSGYAKFLRSLADVQIAPNVQTPLIMIDPDDVKRPD